MNATLSSETFATLLTFSAHTALTGLSARSEKRDLESLDQVLTHIEAHGFGDLQGNTHMHVHLNGMPKKKDDKAKDTPSRLERMTSAMARFMAPHPVATQHFGKKIMLGQNFWSATHDTLFERSIAAIQNHGTRSMLGDFAFDVVSTIPRAECIDKLLAAGVKPGETGKTPSTSLVDDPLSLVHEAFAWENLPAAEVLVRAMPMDKFPALATALMNENGMRHAMHGDKHINFGEVTGIWSTMIESEDHHAVIDKLLRTLDHKDQALGAQVRNAILANFFERATGTVRSWTWSEKNVALLMGTDGVDVTASPLVRLAKTLDPAQRTLTSAEQNVMHSIASTLAHAISAHCATFVKAFPQYVTPDIMGKDLFSTIGRTVSTGSIKIATDGCLKPGMKERFSDTLQALLDMGLPLDYAPEARKSGVLHCLASNTNENDRTHKLPVLLALGANPDCKNENGSKPRMRIKDTDQRAAWDDIVNAHQARSAAHDVLAEIDAQRPKVSTPRP